MPFSNQKNDLIAELKMSKDIIGIKKMKVERVKMEEKQEKEIMSEISRQFSVDVFVEKVGNVSNHHPCTFFIITNTLACTNLFRLSFHPGKKATSNHWS